MSYLTIPEMFIKTCEQYGSSKSAFLYKKDGKYIGINYVELREKVECFALGLLNLGIKSNDRVGIISENRLEWVVADFGIVSIGAIDVPIFPNQTAKQEEYIFNDCKAVAVVVSNRYQLGKILEIKDNLPSLRHIIVMNSDFESSDLAVKSMDYIIKRGAEIRSSGQRKGIIEEQITKIKTDDILTLIYTSGTTGNPKGVILTHNNLLSNMIVSIETFEISEKDTFLSYLPFCHTYERMAGYYSAFAGGSTIAMAESLESIPKNILEVKPTIITTVPRLLEKMKKKIYNNIEKESSKKQKIFHWAIKVGISYIKAKFEGKTPLLSKAKYILADQLVYIKLREKFGGHPIKFVSGGAPISDDVCEFFFAIGFSVYNGYGLTECSPVVSFNKPTDVEIGTVGKPLYNLQIKIADDGEILVKGPSVMRGYWEDNIATSEAIDQDGWLYTGDIGAFTENGNLKITDRKKYIFVGSSGKNIAPQPIENLLCQSPYIEQCFLIGERREYCTALITPDFNELRKLADNFGIQYISEDSLLTNDKITQSIKNDIDRLQKDLAKYERVRKFSLLSKPFSIEEGELTPKLSVKRHIVEKNYSELIEQMYGLE